MKKTYPLCCKLALALFLVFLTTVSYSQTPITQTFNSSGSFTAPSGVTSITVEAWGAGGKGGNKTTGSGDGGGGGGGGAYSRSVITVTPGNTYNYIVGTGSTTTAAGGDTSFNTTQVLAKGGNSVLNNISVGAAGGQTLAGVGDQKYAGGTGFSPSNGNGGGGGSSAGSATTGNNASSNTGATAPADGGDGGNGRSGSDGNGSSGNIPGGGGGGARRNGTGGSGANGQIRISYVPLYRAEFTGMSIGNLNWCPGETRTITVTVKNIGSATWTNSSPDINIGVKWNADADYFVRTDANNLAPGASQTYSLTVTAPTGSTTNNLTFDVVNEGACWFGNNNGTCGPGNTVYTSTAINTFCFSNGPGGIVANLQLWLRADLLNGTNTVSDNANVTAWQTQAAGSNATVNTAGQEPKFRNTPTLNANFNAVVNFNNDPANAPESFDYTATPQKFLEGPNGYYTQDIFIVSIPNRLVNSSTPSMDMFCGDSPESASNTRDGSGIGYGAYSVRYDNEVISYAIGGTSTSSSTPVNDRGYGVAQTGSASYSAGTVNIINARNLAAGGGQELFYNATKIDNTTVGTPQFININNSRYWIGRSQAYRGSLDARVAEVITYSSRKNDASERNRIETYLGIKYGITLGTNGVSQNYVNSSGGVIWDITTNSGFNFNIAGIGRDDASRLTQKQSRSSNSAAEVAIGLGEVAATNTANPNTFSADRQFLVWGSNNSPLAQNGTVAKTVTLGSGITTTFFEAQRKYKIVESGSDVAQTVVSLPKSSLTSTFTKTGTQEYVLIVSSTANFASADIIDIIPLTDTGTNFETWYDFDATKFFSFGVANISTTKYRLENDSSDFVVGEKDVNLNNAFTVSSWIRTTNNNGVFVAKSGAYQFYVNNNGKVVGNWNNADRVVSNATVTTGRWHYVTITFASGTAKIYIDGVLDATATGQPTPATNSNNFSIGGVWTSKASITSRFLGDIDEIRIWTNELTETQLRFIMNQEILKSGTNTFGKVIPNTITKNDIATLSWNNLQAYYDMNTLYGTSIKDLSDNNRYARIKYLSPDNNIIAGQTAPLPYVSSTNGLWQNTATWSNGAVQNIANGLSLVTPSVNIDWNIVQTQNAVESQGNKTLLGLIVSSNTLSATNDSKIEVSHYLDLDGKIDLVGESQLIQTLNSDLDATSAGSIERDQQGTKIVYDYNYWCSPVGTPNTTSNNNSYTVSGVFKDGTTTTPTDINWVSGYNGSPTSPITLASFWIYRFQSAAGDYANWVYTGPNGTLNAAQGFTLKGSGAATTNQNYTFVGKPNNGLIQFSIGANLINLTGNPYASAMDAQAFISANNVSTTGTLYFWDHFGGGTHNLMGYQGGYATYNNLGGVVAMSHPSLSNVGPGTKQPQRYVAVGQGFFIQASAAGGNVIFNNNQRAFFKEDGTNSVMFRNGNQTSNIPEVDYFMDNSEDEIQNDNQFMKIRLGYKTKDDYRRQVLLGFANENATSEIDPGYDAVTMDDQENDMYFLHGDKKLIIQGDGFFNINNSYQIGVKSSGVGTVKFAIDEIENFDENQPVYIFDSLTAIYHNIKTETFQIELPEGTFDERFSLRFTNGENLGTETPTFLNGIQVAFTSNNNVLHIKNQLVDTTVNSATLFSILGQKLATYTTENQVQEAIEIPITTVSSGTYIIKIQTSKGDLSKKIIIK